MRNRVFVVSLLIFALAFSAGAKTLEVWLTGHSNEEMRILEEIIYQDWVAKTGINVELTVLSWADFEQRFLLAAAAGEGPDVGGMGGLFAPELGLRGAVIDLASTFPDFAEVQARSFPGNYRSLTYLNAVFGVPYSTGTYIGYARTDIFEELGLQVPKTWTDLKRDLPRMQARNTNFTLTWGLGETVYADVNMFMWQNGGDDYTPDLNFSGLDQPEAIAGFIEFTELYTKFKIPSELPGFQGFSSGDVAMTIQGLTFYTSLKMGAPQLAGRWEMVLAPGTTVNGKTSHATFTGPGALTIFNSSRQKQEAWEFIKWISSTEVQARLANDIQAQIQGAFFVPANREAVNLMNIDPKDRQTLLAQIDHGVASIYGLVAPRHRRRYLQFAAQEAVTLGMDPAAAMRKYAAEHNAEIRRKQEEYARFISRLKR